MQRAVKAYLAEIGRRGGRKSRRTLTPEAAREMVRVREARRAARRFQAEYLARVHDLSIVERVRRAEELFNWSRDTIARSIVAERGPLSDDDLRWELALRHYGADPNMRTLIEELRNRASR